MHEQFVQFKAKRYPVIRSQYPSYGRRKWNLRLLAEFWDIHTGVQTDRTLSENSPDMPTDSMSGDYDAFDLYLQGEELGILIRTDYSNEDAWSKFVIKLQEGEKEVMETAKLMASGANTEPPNNNSSFDELESVPGIAQSQPEVDDVDDVDAESSVSDDDSPPIIKILNFDSEEERALVKDISNLTALRLLNDVDIRPTPQPQPGTRRILEHSPLIDSNGLQEVYFGKNLWIYDSQSNTDQTVRVVSQAGDIYGTATGDSWRARVAHICELQYDISHLGMKIDFGGLDQWNHGERQRNIKEAQNVVF